MRRRWTPRQMLWWFFVAALILPYLIALIPDSFNPLVGFSFADTELAEWILEIDSSAQLAGGGGSTSRNDDHMMSDHDYVVTVDKATPDEIFSQLIGKIDQKLARELWCQTEGRYGNESFQIAISHGISRYRLYVWNIPLRKSDRDYAEATGKQDTKDRLPFAIRESAGTMKTTHGPSVYNQPDSAGLRRYT